MDRLGLIFTDVLRKDIQTELNGVLGSPLSGGSANNYAPGGQEYWASVEIIKKRGASFVPAPTAEGLSFFLRAYFTSFFLLQIPCRLSYI